MSIKRCSPRGSEPCPSQARSHRVRGTRRKGTVVICVLACVLIVSGLLAATVRSALQSRRLCKDILIERQTEWLLQAGVERARAFEDVTSLANTEWSLPASVLGQPAAVRYAIQAGEEHESGDEQLRVVAILLPAGDAASEAVVCQRSQVLPIELPGK